MQTHHCPNQDCNEFVVEYDPNEDDEIVCPLCGQVCELDYYNDGLSAHHWYLIKKECDK